MITVAAVAIIWSTVIPMIKDAASSATAEKVSLTIETSGGYTVYDSTSSVAIVQVSRGIDSVNLTGIKITFFDGKESYSVEESVPNTNGQTIYKVPLGILIPGFGKPIKISISPIFANRKEGAILSEITNPKESAKSLALLPGDSFVDQTSGEVIVIPTNYNVHSCDRQFNGSYDDDWNGISDVVVCAGPLFCTLSDLTSGDSGSSDRCTDGSVGSLCSDNGDCLYSLCKDSVCIEKREVGGDCYDGTHCVSGFCNTYHYICSSGAIGDTCSSNSDCSSNACDTHNYLCKSDKSIGTSCGSLVECSTGLFCNTYNHNCTNGAVGDGCNFNGECSTNYCNTLGHNCSTGANDQPCGAHNQCSSNYCSPFSNTCKTPGNPMYTLNWTGSGVSKNWSSAISNCTSPWRFPTSDELFVALYLWNETTPNPSNFIKMIAGQNSEQYWTNISYDSGRAGMVYKMNGQTGFTPSWSKTASIRFRCVKPI